MSTNEQIERLAHQLADDVSGYGDPESVLKVLTTIVAIAAYEALNVNTMTQDFIAQRATRNSVR